jgi:hypothetical protein
MADLTPLASIVAGCEVMVEYPEIHDLHRHRFTVLDIVKMPTLGYCAVLDSQRRHPETWAFDVTLPLRLMRRIEDPPAGEPPP